MLHIQRSSRYLLNSIQLLRQQKYQFSSTILDTYNEKCDRKELIADQQQIDTCKDFDSLRNKLISSHSDWNQFQSVVSQDVQSFYRRVEREKEAAKNKEKTKDMFHGMQTKKDYHQKKGGLFGVFQSNTQPIWEPIKDHNMDSHAQISHKYDFSQIEKYPLQKHKGLYIFGHPGSGKTFLMDMFYNSIPFQEKYRVHFDRFMMEFNQEMHQVSKLGVKEPQCVVAIKKAQNIRLLCLDEFQVTDIANAMILKSIFEVFFKNNVVVVTTSNRHPDELYKGGLNREVFEPFIPFLKSKCDLRIIKTQDYRKIAQEKTQNYFYPLGLQTDIKILEIYSNIAGQQKFEPKVIEIMKNLSIKVEKCYNGVAMFNYEDLILANYGPTEYLTLAKSFHTFILRDVPKFNLKHRDAMRRFITFVDIIYDSNAKLYISADCNFDELFDVHNRKKKMEDELDEAFYGHDLFDEEFAFNRTISRVIEMQTKSYQQKPSLYQELLSQQAHKDVKAQNEAEKIQQEKQ